MSKEEEDEEFNFICSFNTDGEITLLNSRKTNERFYFFDDNNPPIRRSLACNSGTERKFKTKYEYITIFDEDGSEIKVERGERIDVPLKNLQVLKDTPPVWSGESKHDEQQLIESPTTFNVESELLKLIGRMAESNYVLQYKVLKNGKVVYKNVH